MAQWVFLALHTKVGRGRSHGMGGAPLYRYSALWWWKKAHLTFDL